MIDKAAAQTVNLKENQQTAGTAQTLVVLQPGYLPWLGFFDQMRRSDYFILYDDVQYDKHGWRNRNRLKSPKGPYWLTVPVHVKHIGQRISDVEIDNRLPWARKHLGSIRQFYRGAPYLNRYLPELEELLNRRWEYIVDLDIALIQQLCVWLDLSRPLIRSSTLHVEGSRVDRLLNLCLHFNANCYLSGDAAKSYLDVDLFKQHNIEVHWQEYSHPIYPQINGEFVPYLSVLDLLLNCGNESSAILSGKTLTNREAK